ncbi:MAG: nucleotidyltransferase domain-containing protein [bacterium]|nr:nucleotidyltransferase domain-containing protein [bacterium]
MRNKNLTKQEITDKLRENRKILELYGVKRIGLFGSYIRSENKKNSDIDLVVEFDRKKFGQDFKGLFDAFTDLTAYMERLFNRKVDILTADSIKTIRIKEVAEAIQRSIVYV